MTINRTFSLSVNSEDLILGGTTDNTDCEEISVRAIRRDDTRDFWTICVLRNGNPIRIAQRTGREETMNFILAKLEHY